MNYSKLPLLTIPAVKELNRAMTELKAENAALKTRVAQLERLVNALVTKMPER